MNEVAPPHRINPVFAELTQDPEDDTLRGFIAYGLYKTAKREWATRVFEQHGRGPTAEELDGYVMTWTPAQFEGKRAEATAILQQYAGTVVSAARPDIEKAALQGSLTRAIGYGLLTNLVYTVLLFAVYVALRYIGIDLIGIAKEVGSPAPPAISRPAPPVP